MRHNPLDPYAFDTEERPFIITGKATPRELHLGVHTASSHELALVYAVQRAMVAGSTAVILHLDTAGLSPLPDRDVILAAEQNTDLGLLHDSALMEATDANDPEGVADALADTLEDYEDESGETPQTWTEAVAQVVMAQHARDALAALADLDPDDALAAMEDLRDRGALPKQVWMEAVGQQRYLSEIGFDRLVRVDLVRPLRNDLWSYEERDESGEDYPPDEPAYPEVFSAELFSEDAWTPNIVTVWKRKPHKGARIEYHGTDTTRAASAFPEIADTLVSPWPYTQEEEPDIASPGMFQALTEKQAAERLGVGIFPLALSTGRFLLGERSWMVGSPEQWGGFGGTLNVREEPEDGAMRELREETGYTGEAQVYEFAPSIFIAELPDEYHPKLNWETTRAKWVSQEQMLKLDPKYWGLEELIKYLDQD